MSLSMFTIIPMPEKSWEDEAVRFVSIFLPVAGMVTGGFWYLLYTLMIRLFGSNMAVIAVVAVFPYVITGLLHLDGFMDTCDAILSRRDLPERLRILKDSHVGAFGVISVVILVLLQFSAVGVVAQKGAMAYLAIAPVLSRTLSGAILLRANYLEGSSLVKFFQEKGRQWDWAFILCIGFGAAAAAYLFLGGGALYAIAAVLAGYLVSFFLVYRNLGGFSGDLSGYCISVSECFCALVLALAL